jgi:hypothetical protein
MELLRHHLKTDRAIIDRPPADGVRPVGDGVLDVVGVSPAADEFLVVVFHLRILHLDPDCQVAVRRVEVGCGTH